MSGTAKRLGIGFAVGLLMGAVYALIHVMSPAPVPVALVGLLGIVIGEHAVLAIRTRVRIRRHREGAVERPSDG